MPPDADGEFVWHMEDVIQAYLLPYDLKRPQVCFDEASRQLFGEVRRPGRVGKGKHARTDYCRVKAKKWGWRRGGAVGR